MSRKITYYTQDQISDAIERHRVGEGMTHLEMMAMLKLKNGAYALRRKKRSGWKFSEIQILKKKGILR